MNLLLTLILIPIVGIFLICNILFYSKVIEANLIEEQLPAKPGSRLSNFFLPLRSKQCERDLLRLVFPKAAYAKQIALIISIINLIISFVIFISFNSGNQFIWMENFLGDITLGIDGQNILFILLTTLITPICILSNWKLKKNIRAFLILILLLESLLLSTFLVVDLIFFYIFFESTLIPLFLLIGMFGGSENKIRASFYLFLYTLAGSLFLLLSFLQIGNIAGTTDIAYLQNINLDFNIQKWLFLGIFIAICVKTPIYPFHTWLLKAHVEAPLSVSILLAAIVLKLSLYLILRVLLPILPEACQYFSPLVYTLCVISIIYGSLSTLRTVNIKEIVAYSSVCHAAVYIMGAFSNTVTGIEGSIVLGIAHGFVSSGLFICVGGVLYERTGTLNIFYYRGMAQLMPLFSILFFIFSLANCGTPLTLNFVGEFLSLYGAFERLPLASALACSSIVFSAAYSIYLFNRVAFGGSFSLYFKENLLDLDRREFFMLFALVFFTITLGIYPSILTDVLHYSVSSLIYKSSSDFALAFLPLVFSPNKTDAASGSVLLKSSLFHFSLHGCNWTFSYFTDKPVKIYANVEIDKLQILRENRRKSGLYCFKNLENGEIYIGSSCNLSKRLTNYYSYKLLSSIKRGRSKILASLKKNGYSNFSLEILKYCDPDKVLEREQYYIDTLKPAYKILPTTGSHYGAKRTEETVNKLKQFGKSPENLARWQSMNYKPEVKARLKEHLNYLNSSPEDREHLKLHLQNLNTNPEHIAKRQEALKIYKNTGVSRLIKGRYRIIAEETKDFPIILPESGKPERSSLPLVQIEVMDTETTCKTIFPFITNAARFLGCRPIIIEGYFTRNQKKPYCGRYVIKKLSN